MSEPRYNEDAEVAVLSTALISPAAVARVVSGLTGGDFYRPAHIATFYAIEDLYNDGYEVDIGTVVDRIKLDGKLDLVDGGGYVRKLLDCSPGLHALPTYISIVRREARARAVLNAAAEAIASVNRQDDPAEVVDALVERIASLDRGGRLPEEFYPSVLDYTESEPPSAVPLIEGLLYQRTRVIVLAAEKQGKSWLLRQIALCAAAGLHPFTFKPIEPVSVLLLDAENDADELVPSIRTIRGMVARLAGEASPVPSLLTRPYGMDLRSPRDLGELEAVLSACRPQLVIGGPVYKLMPRRPGEDVDAHAAGLHRILDDIRRRWGCAMMLEHHAPTGKQGIERELRSKGGQQWAAWPEVTVALRGAISGGTRSLHVGFPHPPRGSFLWPRKFDRGTRSHEWPWAAVWRADDAPSRREPLGVPEVEEEPF